MILRVKPDKQKSESLKNMAKITLERLDKTDMDKYPSNTLLDYYDVVHKLIEAITLRDGIKVKGEGAHQELIDHVAREKIIDQHMQIFLQNMRDYRNRIFYESFMIDKRYIDINKDFIKKIILHLFNELE